MRMAETLQRLFTNPPIAVARLGGSTTPQNSYKWVESPNPRSNGETTIEPDWSLVVQSDGTVEPVMPTSLAFRDGALIRPVCPFIELWASVGEPGSDPSTWKEVPVTPDLLTKNSVNPNSLVIKVDAKNLKVSRRTGNDELRFGTFPPIEVRGDNHTPVQILAGSPPGVAASRRMIPANQNIPLGSLQVMKSRPQPAPDPTTPWTQLVDGIPTVNVELIRFRFTPARGHFYGPPNSAQLQPVDGGLTFAPVESTRAFLNANAGWAGFNALSTVPDAPADTYDGADIGQNRSLGVVDDTCEVRLDISLTLPAPINKVLTASTAIFVSPPDFAPDRRPFLSLADELNDRAGDSASRTALMSAAERDAWVEDLFERIYETVSLLNLDFWRSQKAIRLTGNRLTTPIPGDQTSAPTSAMGSRDALRNRSFALPAAGQDTKLPLSEHARFRHRQLSDLQALRDFISQNPGRLTALVRRSFEAERGEESSGNGGIGSTTMRMPPFMRNSNAGPLTLAGWQYDLLMAWVNAIEAPPAPAPPSPAAALTGAAAPLKPLSEAATRRRAQVLARIARTRNPGGG
jgi:hypothetical protein